MRTLSRFGDHGESISVDLNGTEQTYFSGPYNKSRMELIRHTIEYVRSNWGRYSQVPDSVVSFLDNIFPQSTEKYNAVAILNTAFAMHHHWADRSKQNFNSYDFPLIAYYTSEAGHQSIFKEINKRFREVNKDETWQDFIPHTWIIELFNMELFAHSISKPHIAETDTLYRGVVFENRFQEDYERFGSTKLPHSERMASIPLGLYSTSYDRNVAKDFVERDIRGVSDPSSMGIGKYDHFSTIWNIHIGRLTEDQLSIYSKLFPNSVISGICATDISSYSQHPSEKEVLLRGPFFEIIDCIAERPICELPSYSMHAVMIDNNRDHISTFELGEKSEAARQLFNKLVNWQKYQICSKISAKLSNQVLHNGYMKLANKFERDALQFSRDI